MKKPFLLSHFFFFYIVNIPIIFLKNYLLLKSILVMPLGSYAFFYFLSKAIVYKSEGSSLRLWNYPFV